MLIYCKQVVVSVEIVVRFGLRQTNLDSLYAFAECLACAEFDTHEYKHKLRNGYIGQQPRTGNIQLIYFVRDEHLAGRRTSLSLAGFLTDTTLNFRASDPRDMCYALLGVAEEGMFVTPDYRIDCCRLYAQLQTRFLAGSLGLEYLAIVNHRHLSMQKCHERFDSTLGSTRRWETDHDALSSALCSLPTWVPDFNITRL